MWRLFEVYYQAGFIFLLVHCFVAATCLHLWWYRIRRERVALSWWPERVDRDSAAVRMLEHFVGESRVLGRRGLLLPVTELSERLNSRAAVYIDRLHSRINLFLIVGVAGTFFAMFQFVLRAGSGDTDISAALKEGLMQAFPIGFFGLVWTFLGHFAAFAAEEKLRDAINAAIRRATERRTGQVHTAVEELAKALEPFRDVQQTLRDSLAPVIEEFRQALERTTQWMRGELQPLMATLAGLDRSVSSLASVTEGMPDALEGIAKLQAETSAVVKRMTATASKLESNSEAAARELIAAAGKLKTLSDSLTEELAKGLAATREEVTAAWRGAIGEFVTGLVPACALVRSTAEELRSAGRELAALPDRLQGAAERMASVFQEHSRALAAEAAASWREAFREPLAALKEGCSLLKAGSTALEKAAGDLVGVPERLDQAAAQMVSSFGEHSRGLAEQVSKSWADSTERFLQDVARRAEISWTETREASHEAARLLKEAAGNLNQVSNTVDHILKYAVAEAYRGLADKLAPDLARIQRAVTFHYPAVLNHLAQAAERSAEIAKHVERVREELKSAAEEMSKSADAIRRGVEEARKLPGTIRLDEDALRVLRNIEVRIDSASQGLKELRNDLALPTLRRWFGRFGDRRPRS
jgi:methyl-accepting chemotaxis protein